MSLDNSSYNPKLAYGGDTFLFNTVNVSGQAVCYLDMIAGFKMPREFNVHKIAGVSGVLFSSIRDSGIVIPVGGEIQAADQDEYWRTQIALRTALGGADTDGLFSFYLHEDGGTNEWRLDNCASEGPDFENYDDRVFRAGLGRFPRWSTVIRSKDAEATVISGGETLSGGAASGVKSIDGPLRCKGLVIVDDTGTPRGKIAWENAAGKCILRIDGDMRARPGLSVSLPGA